MTANETLPSSRYLHAATDMYIFGGLNGSHWCLHELWKFSLDVNYWEIVKGRNSGPNIASMRYCIFSAAGQAGQLWVFFEGCETETCTSPKQQFWTFLVYYETWHRLSVGVASETVYPLGRMVFWRGHLLMLDGSQMAIFYLRLGCPRGYTSADISYYNCSLCPTGSYGEKGSSFCRSCPEGTTTTKSGSESLSDCGNYCKKGVCLSAYKNSLLMPVCEISASDCNDTSTACNHSTNVNGTSYRQARDYHTHYIVISVLLAVIATSATVSVILCIKERRKSDHHAANQVTNELWQISRKEVTTLEEVGAGRSGRVWKARYRDITVTMTILNVARDHKVSSEFTRDMKFLQTIRHPNIALVLGAGETDPPEQPFIIVEYPRRGSLRQVLDDQSSPITVRRKVQFSLDAARGMQFLHNLNPPRIHQNLKTESLLVSEDWTVKVTDITSLRQASENLSGLSTKRTTVTRFGTNGRSSVTMPLLETGQDVTTQDLATTRCAAPELSRCPETRCSVDVYR